MGIQELIVYWEVVRKRLWLIGLLMVATLGAMLLFFYLSKPVYEAAASFQVNAPLPGEVAIFSEFRAASSRDEIIYTRRSFLSILQSEFILWQVIEELDLNTDIRELQEQIDVEQPVESSEFLELHVRAQDPELAAAIANTLLDKAARYMGELSAGAITANKEFIQQQIRDIRGELDEARAALIQFQIENRTGSLDGFLKSQESLITSLKSNRDDALAKGDTARASGYEGIITARQLELQELILLSAQYEALQTTVARIEEIYARLLDKETEAELKENEILSAKFVLVVPALEPAEPLPRIKTAILVLGAVLSLALGIALAFVLEYLENVAVETDKGSKGAFPTDVALALGQDE